MRADNDAFYKTLGWKPGKKESPHEIPNYKVQFGTKTSDAIPGHGKLGARSRYTGDELLGIATMHKSNAVPIRKDNKEQAAEVSQMRRN